MCLDWLDVNVVNKGSYCWDHFVIIDSKSWTLQIQGDH